MELIGIQAREAVAVFWAVADHFTLTHPGPHFSGRVRAWIRWRWVQNQRGEPVVESDDRVRLWCLVTADTERAEIGRGKLGPVHPESGADR